MKGYLLDTNIISEVRKKTGNLGVVSWVRSVPADLLYISVITLGEIRRGIEMLDETPKKAELNKWLVVDLEKWFEKRILPVDQDVADKWGYIAATSKPVLPLSDSLIGATCIVHNLVLVTRNVKDFQIPGLEIINPFVV